jgi:hypothetical protein
VKIGLLCVALMLAAVNLVRTRPRLIAANERPELGAGAATLLRRLVSARRCSWRPRSSPPLSSPACRPRQKRSPAAGSAIGHVGPGPVKETVDKNGYHIVVRVSPNRAAAPNAFTLQITKGGKPVSHANVIAGFSMLDMEMGTRAT